jgi:hypothetical protein
VVESAQLRYYRKNRDACLERRKVWGSNNERRAFWQKEYDARRATARKELHRSKRDQLKHAGLSIASLKRRAVSHGWEFTLTNSWLQEKFSIGKCELTGLPFKTSLGKVGPYSPTVDRIDSSKGYTEDNCRVILWALNAGFGNWGLEIALPIWKELIRSKGL